MSTEPDPTPEKEYVLGTGQDELDRLALQHRLWSDAAHAAWRWAGLRLGARALDLGAGVLAPRLVLLEALELGRHLVAPLHQRLQIRAVLAQEAPERVQPLLDLVEPLRIAGQAVEVAPQPVRHVLEQRVRLGDLGAEAAELGVERPELDQVAPQHAEADQESGGKPNEEADQPRRRRPRTGA